MPFDLGSIMRNFANRQGPINAQGASQTGGFTGPLEQPQPSTPIPQVAQAQTPTQEMLQATGEAAVESDQKKSKFMDFLVKAGVPIGAAIWGTVGGPDAMASAAGLAQGYNQGRERQEDYQLKADAQKRKSLENLGDGEYAIVDPDNPEAEPQIIKLKPGAKVIKKGGHSSTTDDIMAKLDKEFGKGGGPDAATQSLEKTRAKYSAADIKHTAEQHGISEEEVLKQLEGNE